jgi:glycosyltransferase involved in cell wall biosynthesis
MALRFLLLDQLQALQARGHDVVAVCAPGPWVPELRAKGVAVETVAMRREPSPAADIQSVANLYRIFRRHRFDVVHTHTPKAGLLGPVAARMAGVPVVVHTVHGLLFHDGQSRARQMLYWIPERITAAFADRLLSQSREDVARALSARLCRPQKITWIGNGIDLRKFSRNSDDRGAFRREFGLGPEDFVVGCVGRLVIEKGLCELFEAVRSLALKYPLLKLLVIGFDERGHSKAVPSATMEAVVRSGAVVFAGVRTDMPRCYAAMDLLVHPSHREGVPRACLEASAMELPVIACDVRGCREAIVPGETGLLVPVRSPQALSEAIERLMLNRSLCRAMGAAGRKSVCDTFDHRMVLRRLLNVYQEIEYQLGESSHPTSAPAVP